MGKARVAPMKHYTLPSLKLMAVVTATRLKQILVEEHECNFNGIFIRTDLTTVILSIRINKKQPVSMTSRKAEILDWTTMDNSSMGAHQWHNDPS